MAPEHINTETQKSEQTDVFSLGCLLHSILTGFSPFEGRTKQDGLKLIEQASFPPPRLRYPQRMIPESLEAVILKACARMPENRYASVADLGADVQKFLDGYATEAEEPGFIKAARLFLSRHQLGSAVTLISVIILSCLGILALQRMQDQREATELQSQRAAQSESRADALDSLYQSELTRSAESRRELAAKLAISANSLKNLGIFENPAKTVQEAKTLASVALALDPTCEKGQIELFSLNCLTLNFGEALTVGIPSR